MFLLLYIKSWTYRFVNGRGNPLFRIFVGCRRPDGFGMDFVIVGCDSIGVGVDVIVVVIFKSVEVEMS